MDSKNINYIYVGSSKSEAVNEELRNMGSVVNYAGNTHQNAILDGLGKLCKNLTVISCWTISPYPVVRKVFFERRVESIGQGKDNNIFTGIINIKGLNFISKLIRTRRELKKVLSKTEKNAVVVYETHTPFLLAAVSLRKKIQHISVIVPDLPEHMIAHQNVFRKYAKKVDRALLHWCMSKCDSYILLAKRMQERLPMENKKWVLMEGLFRDKISLEGITKDEHKTIMYTGILHKDKGIKNLIDAFEMIENPDYRLWIRGYGDYADEIVRISKEDPRIVYLPPMSHEELVKTEQKATVMVNPTQPHLEFTHYFFPSKTMEYLASGTPTVMYRLSCMPSEYDEHIYYVDGDDTKSLADKLVEVCEKPKDELNLFGTEAHKFIMDEKNPMVQCQKIVDLIQNNI